MAQEVVVKPGPIGRFKTVARYMLGVNSNGEYVEKIPRVTHENLEEYVMGKYKDSPDYSINNVNGYGETEIPIPAITSSGISLSHHKGHPSENIGPLNIGGRMLLLADLFIPSSANNIFSRGVRFAKEELYIVSNTFMEKVNTVCIIAALVIAIIIWYRSYILELTQVYVFKKDLEAPEDRLKDYDTLERLRRFLDIPGTEVQNETLTADLKELVERNASKVHDEDSIKKLKEYNETLNSRNMYYAKLALSIVPGIVAVWSIFKRTSVHRSGPTEEHVRNIQNAWPN